MTAVEHLCTRGVFLKEGKVQLIDTVEKVLTAYLQNEEAPQNQNKIPLANGVTINNFSLSEGKINSLSKLSFSFSIKSDSPNRITELVLLMFNHLNERIGIVDLRHNDLWTKSAVSDEVFISGAIENIPLIEGAYSLGIYISSVKCQGDFLNLKRLDIGVSAHDFMPYAIKHRGYVEFDTKFQIS